MRTSKPIAATVTVTLMTDQQEKEFTSLLLIYIGEITAHYFKEIENDQLREHEVCGDLSH